MNDPDSHTRLIGWLKIALPLLALAILSTLFLVARTIDPSAAIPYAEVDVEERLREPRMTAPTYAGLTEDGAALTVAAAEARPAADGGGASASGLDALLETPDGAQSRITARSGQIDTGGGQLLLSGGVTLTSSSGWTLQSDALTAALDRTGVTSPGAVTATGPAGTVTAQSLHLSQNPADPARYLLVFNGGVKLIYQPAQ